jgi:hypothetical protein
MKCESDLIMINYIICDKNFKSYDSIRGRWNDPDSPLPDEAITVFDTMDQAIYEVEFLFAFGYKGGLYIVDAEKYINFLEDGKDVLCKG